MKAIILSAGQGSRLLPLTEGKPKCLLSIGPRTLIEWQIWALTQGGVDDVAVVVGYHARDVQDLLKRLEGPKLKIRHEMAEDFVILNGDTVIQPAIFQKLLASPAAPITVTIDKKEGYDADDMKVHLKGEKLLDIGKTLPPERTDGESIGMLLFRGEGPKLFTHYLDDIMHTPEGLKWWYLRAIGQIAERANVMTCNIEGLSWGEVDFPVDLERVNKLVEDWA
jgi:choline kinase